ncbi:MAG: hypothetical protein AAF558_11370 [Verrucomicrobiota bacterium]
MRFRPKVKSGSGLFWVPLVGSALLLFVVGGYFAYFWGKGVASYHVSGGGIASSQSGYQLGFDTFSLQSGQSIQVEYQLAERKSGYLTIQFWREGSLSLPKIVDSIQIKQEKKGSHRFRARSAGTYRIGFSPTPDGNGYDYQYSANWYIK